MKNTRKGNGKIAVAYCRASKDEQRLSPEAQRAAIEVWAAREGVTVDELHHFRIALGTEIPTSRSELEQLVIAEDQSIRSNQDTRETGTAVGLR